MMSTNFGQLLTTAFSIVALFMYYYKVYSFDVTKSFTPSYYCNVIYRWSIRTKIDEDIELFVTS